MNPYLERLRKRHDNLRSSIDALMKRAADESRDLTDAEVKSIEEQGAEAAGLRSQMKSLTEIEVGNQQDAELRAV